MLIHLFTTGKTVRALAMVALLAPVASSQKTTTVNFLLSFTATGTQANHYAAMLYGNLGPLNAANVSLDGYQPVDDNGKITDNFQGTLSVAFNRADGFDLPAGGFQLGASGGAFTSNIAGGRGQYKGATGSATLTLTPKGTQMSLSGSGTIIVAGKTTQFTISSMSGPFVSFQEARLTAKGGGNLPPLESNFTSTLTGEIDDTSGREAVSFTLTFTSGDTLNFLLTFNTNGARANLPAVVAGGTGAYAGANGNATLTVNPTPDGTGFSVTGFGTVNQRPAGTPAITEIRAAYGGPEIGQNMWITVKGTNLVPSNTPSSGVDWSNATEFKSGQMPMILQNVGVNVNGQRGYISFFCSAVTDPNCSSDQINLLTPIDSVLGPISVFVNNNGTTSAPFIVPMRSVGPSLLDFDVTGHVVGTHLDGSLLAPAALYPNLSTPAKPGETIVIYPIGFGMPTTTVTAGSATQFGTLPKQPACFVDATPATIVSSYIISPGLAQIALVVPPDATSGDHLFYCSYPSAREGARFTSPANLLAVQ